MARPHKKTVGYFPHVTNANDRKTIPVLQSKWGNDGYAFWFKLLELLGRSPGLFFDYNEPSDLEFLSAKTNQKDTETVLKMLETLDVLRALDHELYKNNIIWIQNFVDGVADAFGRSVNGVPEKPDFKLMCKIKGNLLVETTEKATDTTTEIPQPNLGLMHDNKSKLQTITAETMEKATETMEKATENTQSKLKEIKVKYNHYQLYENNIGILTPKIADELKDIEETYPYEWFNTAVKEACLKNARNLKYILAILERWQRDGFNSNGKKKSSPNRMGWE